MNKKRTAILGSALTLVLALIFSFASGFLALGQFESPNKAKGETQPSNIVDDAPEWQDIDEYFIYSLTSNNGVTEIRLYNDIDGQIGQLFFYPDEATLPADYVNAYDQVILYYHKKDYEKVVDLLRNEYPHLEYSYEYHGIFGWYERAAVNKREAIQFLFDFGTANSPLEEGFTRVTESTQWSDVLGYGWYSTYGLSSRDRAGRDDDLRRDLVQSPGPENFYVSVPPGRYDVSVIIGDNNYNHDNIDVMIEGVLEINDLSVPAGTFHEAKYSATVTDGILAVGFSDDGGSDINWVINAIRVESTT